MHQNTAPSKEYHLMICHPKISKKSRYKAIHSILRVVSTITVPFSARSVPQILKFYFRK